MKSILFIVNPKAGIHRKKVLFGDIERNLDLKRFRYEMVTTRYAKHGITLAKEAAEKGFDIVVAVGGDGSVNDVVNGLYGTSTALGIIPKGSGNGLARSLGIPQRQIKAIGLLNDGYLQEIDVGEADGRLFVSNAGVGFDTVITDKFDKSNRRGLSAYLSLILKNIWRYPVKDWEVEIEGQKEVHSSFMLTVANAVQLGYGFQIAPLAKLNDGYFDVVSIRKFPKALAASIALRAFLGRIANSPYVTVRQAKEVRIYHPDLRQLQIDGETFPCGPKVKVRMMPKPLKIISKSIL